ncbi:putative protein kinase domain-containing protein [Neofusicoccum parvum UCRNP2]|uniref:Protein kinase domain-containing protein n=1 Tax=Botryosphaeria parva (strain UCR-NP2) TaxID=1287680 RepID=R1GIK4_BOTPV|nr:putative protein kinase domain-containing protein [Neofusicoccum parvum UCRNP2]
MGSKSLTNVVTQNSIALNAYIYGYGGHSLVTPHAPLQQLWWTDDRIDAKVTPEFVASRLRKEERDLLYKPLAFGDGLTDDTYLEWIMERAKRLFLILAEVGVPDQIYGCVDDAWDDQDLPIDAEAVERLALSRKKDDQLNRRFYQTQYTFLLRELHRGTHIAYGPNEVIPIEHVYKLPPAASLQHWSRVHLPKKPDEVFVRRRVSFSEDKEADQEEFLKDIAAAQEVDHQHIAPVWASYTSKGNGFVVSSFVGEHTLKSFIDFRTPTQYMSLSTFDFGFNKAPAKPNDALATSDFADVFSLGCIFLDILTFMIKKKPTEFVKHRTTKHKTPGKSGSRSDSSFHANLDKLNSWMQHLDTVAMEHEEIHFRAVRPLLQLVRDMVQPVPEARPLAYSVAGRLRDLLADHAGMVNLHCEPHVLGIEHTHSAPMSPRSDLHTIPEDGIDDDESVNGDDAYTVADEATLRYSVADSMTEVNRIGHS